MTITKQQQDDLVARTKRKVDDDPVPEIDVEKLSATFGKGHSPKTILVTKGLTINELLAD